jgi:hypothetical protein
VLPGGDVWGGTALDLAFLRARAGTDIISGEAIELAEDRIAVSRICRAFPCALLHFPNTSGLRRSGPT